MKISYKLTELDIINAMRLHSNPSLKIWIVSALCGILVLMLFGFLFDLWIVVMGGIVGGLLAHIAIHYIWLPYAAKKQFREYAALRKETMLEASEQGANFSGENSYVQVSWSEIHKWRSGKGIYLLYVTSRLFYIVPSNAIHQEAEWIQLLNNKIGVRSNL